VPQLRALGIDTIDLVVASHNHADPRTTPPWAWWWNTGGFGPS
jgi:hypothetical protein